MEQCNNSGGRFFALLKEMTNGPCSSRTTGNFTREELYDDFTELTALARKALERKKEMTEENIQEWARRIAREVCDGELAEQISRLQAEVVQLRNAIATHHAQKADDRCIEDDDRLYAAAGLPPCDRRVGSKEEMLINCARFIDRRCEGGQWKSYRELEEEVLQLRKLLEVKDNTIRQLSDRVTSVPVQWIPVGRAKK